MAIAPGVELTPDQLAVRICDRLGFHDLVGPELRRRAETADVNDEIAAAEAADDEDRVKALRKENRALLDVDEPTDAPADDSKPASSTSSSKSTATGRSPK